MTDHYQDEQEMEAEALTAIFDTSFEIISSTQPFTWNIIIFPIMNDDFEEENNNDDDDDANHVGIRLIIELPLTYPDVVPTLDVEIIKGLAEEQRRHILELANTEAEANLGIPAIFTIGECIRSWLVDNNFKGQDDGSMHAQMMRRMKEVERSKTQADQEFESQKQISEMSEAVQEEIMIRKRREEGTPCTLDNFLIWRDTFDTEMAEVAAIAAKKIADALNTGKNNKGKKEEVKKLSGAEIFTRKVGVLDDALLDDDEEEFGNVDEELFDDEDDLDGLDFDEEDDSDDDDDDDDDDEVDI